MTTCMIQRLPLHHPGCRYASDWLRNEPGLFIPYVTGVTLHAYGAYMRLYV